MIKPEELRSWMQQVEDEETTVEDYDFLDKLAHQGSSNNGNNGLANAGAYLAIHRNGSGLEVDEELVDELDRRQANDGHAGENRFSNIVYQPTSEKREGKTLYDRGIDGHQVLNNLIAEFESSIESDSLPSDNESILKDNNQNQTSNNSKGGDNTMTDDAFDNQLRTLAGKMNEMDEYSTEVVHAAARLERQEGSTLDAAAELIDEYRETGIDVQRGVQSWMDEQKGKLQGVNSALQGTKDDLDDFENEYLSGDYGISDSAKDAFSDAAGYDIT